MYIWETGDFRWADHHRTEALGLLLHCVRCRRKSEDHELRLEAAGKKSILNNIYVGQIEKIAQNIQAAFVRFGDGLTGYLPLVRRNW